MILCLALLAARTALAAVEIGQVFQSGDRVFLNFTHNQDYYARDRVFRYRHAVAALDVARERLVGQKKIRSLPLLVRILDPVFGGNPQQTQIALRERGELLEGEADRRSIGPCYEITVVGDDSYDALLTLTAALPRLTSAKPDLAVPNVSRLRAELSAEIAALRGIEIRHDPVPAPDGRHVLSTIWRDGAVRFAVEDRSSGQARSLEPLDGYPATLGVWSRDARTVAYASLQQIKVFDQREDRTRTIPLAPEIPEPNEVLLAFSRDGARLVFTGDRNLLSEYPVLVHDLRSGETRPVATIERPENWPREAEPWTDSPAPAPPDKMPSPPDEPVRDGTARVAWPLVAAVGVLLAVLAIAAARRRRRKLRQ